MFCWAPTVELKACISTGAHHDSADYCATSTCRAMSVDLMLKAFGSEFEAMTVGFVPAFLGAHADYFMFQLLYFLVRATA